MARKLLFAAAFAALFVRRRSFMGGRSVCRRLQPSLTG